MRPGQPVGLLLIFSTLGLAPARAADPAIASVLKDKGLTKSGTNYVIEAEKPVLEKMKAVGALFSVYAKLVEQQAADELVAARLQHLEDRRAEMAEALTELNQRINEQPLGGGRPGPGGGFPPASPLAGQREQVKQSLAEVSLELKTLKSQSPPTKDRPALDAEVKKRGEAFRAALEELRPMVDDVKKKYAKLEADPEIKKARSDLNKATKANIKLGPSDAFKAGAKALEQAERQFLGKKPEARKKAKARK